jgi:hypothetical protein
MTLNQGTLAIPLILGLRMIAKLLELSIVPKEMRKFPKNDPAPLVHVVPFSMEV